MKLIISGSRSINNYALLCKSITDNFDLNEITDIISGGALGIDSLAEIFAIDNSINMTVVRPDWDKYGKSAGPIRNLEMLKLGDQCLVVYDGMSKGSSHMISICRASKMPLVVIKNGYKI